MADDEYRKGSADGTHLVSWKQVGGDRAALVKKATFARLGGKKALHMKSPLKSRLMDGQILVCRPPIDSRHDYRKGL
jgi:hypothetical protein